ncbi:MAG: hypothetical protein V2A72_00535 [Candidatus Omnitrophota bacterium]
MKNYLVTVIPVIALAVNSISQICAYRLVSKFGMLKSIFLGFGVGLACIFLFDFFFLFLNSIAWHKQAAATAVHVITYISLSYCYFNFINLGETARRIRILIELRASPEGLVLAQLLKRYNAQEIVERRLSRLLKNRQVIVKDNAFYIGQPVLLWAAKVIVLLKIILLGKKSEFY